MKVQRFVKRLFAVGAGAAMLGATAMGALATDLSQTPDAFVEDGAFTGFIVVGENALAADTLAAADIAANMFVAEGDSTTTTTTVSGDSWMVGSSGNFFELGETVGTVESYIDDTQLGALADGEISNSKGTADYEQFLYFDENTATVTYQEDDDDNVGYFYKVPNSGVIARYLMDFGDSLESDVDSSGTFDDIEDEQVSILGKMYTITTASNSTGNVKLTIMGGSQSATLEAGETATYTVGGQDYEVSLLSVSTESSTDKAQFTVNGETTDKLADGESDVLEDGTNIGVTEITYQNYAGGIQTATFFIGADKIELEDGQSIKVNEETISEATVTFSESYSSGDISIDSFYVNMTADDDFYIPVGGVLSEANELEEPEVLFTQNWDLLFGGVAKSSETSLSLTFSEGDDQADLKVELYDGEVTIPLAYHNDSTTAYAGEKDGEAFVFNAAGTITDEDYFIVNTEDPDTASNDARSYLLQYKGSDDSGETNPKARIKNVATGETYERTQTASSGNQVFDVKLGGTTFNFQNVSAATSDDFSIQHTSGGNLGYSAFDTTGYQQIFRTVDNHEVVIVQNNASLASGSYQVWVNVDDSDLFDDASDAGLIVLNATVSVGSDELSTTNGGMAASVINDPDDSDISYASTAYGELLTITAQDSGPSKYELDLPSEQAEVEFYVTSGATETASRTVSGNLMRVAVVDATRLDTEVADVRAQHMIVVGGPCANSAAAALMGNPADCTEGFKPGTARVKLFEHANGNMAMLVAGYSADDTRLAGDVLVHRWDELSGDEVEISGSTYSSATIGAPSAVVAAPAEEEEEMSEDMEAEESAEGSEE